jgi:hypothetical protein
MDGGPWLFLGAEIVMADYDCVSNVDDYKLDKILVWEEFKVLLRA